MGYRSEQIAFAFIVVCVICIAGLLVFIDSEFDKENQKCVLVAEPEE